MTFNPHFDHKSVKHLSKTLGFKVFNTDMVIIKAGTYYKTATGIECAKTPLLAHIVGYIARNGGIVVDLNGELITVLRRDVVIMREPNGKQAPQGSALWIDNVSDVIRMLS